MFRKEGQQINFDLEVSKFRKEFFTKVCFVSYNLQVIAFHSSNCDVYKMFYIRPFDVGCDSKNVVSIVITESFDTENTINGTKCGQDW